VDIESYICDVSDPEDIARAAKEIREDVGEPTILINNAAIINGRSILDLSIEDIKRTINVNYLGQAFTIKEFLPDMIKNNHGHIVRKMNTIFLLSAYLLLCERIFKLDANVEGCCVTYSTCAFALLFRHSL
jgi:hypothetical protein